MNPTMTKRTVHIPGVGGPVGETTDGCHVRLDYEPDFKPDVQAGNHMGIILLCSLLLFSTGTMVGWMGHAVLMA